MLLGSNEVLKHSCAVRLGHFLHLQVPGSRGGGVSRERDKPCQPPDGRGGGLGMNRIWVCVLGGDCLLSHPASRTF